jgi:peptidyl-prolyl cis-trans isomerase B (cyclophilin B)
VHVARLLLLALVLALSACGGDEPEATPVTTAQSSGDCATVAPPEPKPDGGQQKPKAALNPAKTYKLAIKTNCGWFTIQLDQKTAPNTAASLVSLAGSRFFNGTIFHRVVPGFVIQGGDPTGSGLGGPGYKTVDVPPPATKYTLGVVAMAKSEIEPPGTSGSQFFVVTGANVGLPPDYAVVGKVTKGMDTVMAIDALGVGDGPPSETVVIERVAIQES